MTELTVEQVELWAKTWKLAGGDLARALIKAWDERDAEKALLRDVLEILEVPMQIYRDGRALTEYSLNQSVWLPRLADVYRRVQEVIRDRADGSRYF